MKQQFSERQFQTESQSQQELSKRMDQLQRAVDEMHVSISERDAEIIRLNLCLGDERKRANDIQQANKQSDMPLQMTPSRARMMAHTHHQHQSSNDMPRMVLDSPFVQKTQTMGIQVNTDTKSVEIQTSLVNINELIAKVAKYEQMLRAESTANEELTEQVQRLERENHSQRLEKERLYFILSLQKINKTLQDTITANDAHLHETEQLLSKSQSIQFAI